MRMKKTTIPSQRGIFYRNAYLYFILAALVVVFAFMPSYFQRLSVTDGAHHLHGITATLWILLLIVQPLLYRTKKLKWHRTIGKLTFVLVPLIILGGLNMVRLMLLNKTIYPPEVPYQLAFIDFFTLALFLLFYIQAIIHRKNIQLHARYMVCTVLGPLIPSLTRLLFIIPYIDNFDKSLNISYVIVEIILLLLLIDDKRSGKIRLPYVLALIYFVVQHILMNFSLRWLWWRNLMDAFAVLLDGNS
jgi:hypothetical protein